MYITIISNRLVGLQRVLSQTLSRDGITRVVGHNYPASAANCWNTDWPESPNCLLRIMCATSIPSSVAEAELKDLKAAVKLMRTSIRLLAEPKSMRSIIDATQREQRYGSA